MNHDNDIINQYTISFFAGLASAIAVVFAIDSLEKLIKVDLVVVIVATYFIGLFAVYILNKSKDYKRLSNKKMFILKEIAKCGYSGTTNAGLFSIYEIKFQPLSKKDGQEYHKYWKELESNKLIESAIGISKKVTKHGLFNINLKTIALKTFVAFSGLTISILSMSNNLLITILGLVVFIVEIFSIWKNNLSL
ncbi:MAG: hypothetical protein HY512_02230 [Candidatus Aenigmarchaeota archaeon]|nr:hypothetical protein [Candidatus Aenigmarchaeota archaeon]